MNSLWIRFRVFAVIALSLLFVAFIVWMVALPLFDMINNQTNDIQNKTLDQQAKQQRIGELNILRKQHEFLVSNRETLNVFITRESAVDAIELIEAIARDTGNEISISIFDEDAQSVSGKKLSGVSGDKKSIISDLPKKEYIRMDIKLLGGYESLYNFLKKIESMRYFGDVISINTQVEEAVARPVSSTGESTNFVTIPERSDSKVDKYSRHLSTQLNIIFYIGG